ncbi:MAG TPA: hemerythrin domain-containing protein, partial [Spirochaetes bacterium]|nr:hemerythrin domain-containing protein [Spirochaetota bacterium]
MSALINKLKQEHIHLFETLDEVKALGISSKKGQERLLSVKNILLIHLKEEDDDLYPPLHKAAESDDKLKGMLNLFIDEMEEISGMALKFFDKYADGGSGLD